MSHFLRATAVVLILASLATAQEDKYRIKTAKTDPPRELSEPIRQLFDSASVQFLDGKGGLVAELWFRKEVPAEATPEQVKNGLGYRDLKETTVFGAVRFAQTWSDYRKQTIKPGVYTLRLGFQPMDGDHMGTSPYPDFLLVSAAAEDKIAGTLEPKALQERSIKTMGTSHPGVLMLFPNNQPGAAPELAAKDNNHLVLNTKVGISVGGKNVGSMGIGLTMVGHAD
jgi:hypothetical protein